MQDFFDQTRETQQAQSAELYIITHTGHVHYYTSYTRDVTYNGQLFEKNTIRRSKIAEDFNPSARKCSVSGMVGTGGVFSFLIDTEPDVAVSVEIYRLFLTSNNVHTIFKGRMRRYTVKNQKADVNFESVGYLTQHRIPRLRLQSYCNNTLFDDACTIDRDEYRIGGRIVGLGTEIEILTDREIVVTTAFNDSFGENLGDKAADYLTDGIAYFDQFYRYVSKSDDYLGDPTRKVLSLQMVFPSSLMVTGTEFNLYPGCGKDPAICVSKFNNLTNFMGFPYIPAGGNVAVMT
jgi:hypothetical protein